MGNSASGAGVDALVGCAYVDFELVGDAGATISLSACLNGLPTLFVFVR